jgi:penicillin-binding protein 1A
VPSLALGSNEVNLLDLTGALVSVRAGRAGLEPWAITAFGPEGAALRSLGPPSGLRELPNRDDLTRLLRAVVERGTGRAAAIESENVVGKTGTSQDYRDAWFVGFTNDLIVGVWVGNDDRTPMKGMTGGALPAQIWKQFVSAATPLMRSRKDADVAAAAEPSSPEPASPSQCDQAACAARYSSFRSSDCTYQPYAGPRRQCEIATGGNSARQRIARTHSDSEGETAEPRQTGAPPSDEQSTSRARTSRGAMPSDEPRSGPLSPYRSEAPQRPFGPLFFKRLDDRSGY